MEFNLAHQNSRGPFRTPKNRSFPEICPNYSMKFVCCLSKTFKKYGILKVQRNLLFHTEFKISIHPISLPQLYFYGCAAEYKIGRYRSQHQKLTLKICFGETQHTRIKVMTAARMVVTGYPHILNSHSRPGCFLRSTIRENTDSNPAQAADKGAHHQKRHEVTGPYENHCHHRINH